MKGEKVMTLMESPVEPEPEKPATAMVQSPGPMFPMIERLAALPDFDVAKLEKLLDMQERILDRNAEAAFNAAFAEMQAAIPTVLEKGKTDKGRYAKQEDIVEVVKPILRDYGFSLSFRTEWPGDKLIKIVGILTHRDGHKRESEFLAEADTSGSKNAIQARGSTVTYGRRYTTTDLLNIISREQRDDDGQRSGRPDPPAGFDEWWKQLDAASEKGTKALEAAWACSADEPFKGFRQYVAKYGSSEMSALRVKARKAGA